MSTEHPAPSPEPTRPGTDNTFFDWMRGLGIPRQPGWIGGVCAGIAARLGIDPIIVRGIVVVIAVLGGPALLLYAAAWLLLPDHYDRIHLQEAIRGNFDKAHAGIGVMFLLSLLPVAQGFSWWQMSVADQAWIVGPSIWGTFWTLAVIGSIVWLVIWLVNRSKTAPTSAPATQAASAAASASAAAHGTTADAPSEADADADAASDTTTQLALPSAPEAPPHPDSGATDDDLAAWKEQQAAWKSEYDGWKQQQAAGERELAQQRTAEQRRLKQEQSAERHRAAIEEQRRTRSNPVYSLVSIGIAIIAGAATALTIGETGDATAAITGMAVSLGVLGLAIIINGFRGKRSGGSSGVAFLLVIALSLTSFFSWANGPLAGHETRWSPSYSDDTSVRRVVATGNMTVDLAQYFDERANPDQYRNGKVDLYVGRGNVTVIVPANERTTVEVYAANGSVEYADPDSGVRHGPFTSGWERFETSDGDHRQDVHLNVWVASGDIIITQSTE